ncbi:MAG TPA: DUF4157 domain-containing protein, partial [Burkholderiaceae bacterium]|nr:DUF4157 domain-containing protein [Burkholderiaceae bacterium]
MAGRRAVRYTRNMRERTQRPRIETKAETDAARSGVEAGPAAPNAIHDSPRQRSQREAFDGLRNSPAVQAQHDRLQSAFGPEPLQRRTEAAPADGGLPEQLKAGIESMSGLAMDDVRVHRDSAEPARIGALAYAQGRDIHLAPGEERQLPHEAWHVVQQAQGRVPETAQMKGMALNDDAQLEREADTMGARAALGPAGTGVASPGGGLGSGRTVQRQANTWVKEPTGDSTPPLLAEIAEAVGLPTGDLLAHWKSQPMMASIAEWQEKCPILPGLAVAALSRVHTDRVENPQQVSVQADIGNLEAALRTAPQQPASDDLSSKPLASLPPITTTTSEPEEPSPKDSKQEIGTESATSPLTVPHQAWLTERKRRQLRAAKMQQDSSGAYQAGHLVAYQFMGGMANQFSNVAPQGAQLNNVAFQNWEHGMLARAIGQARIQGYGAEPKNYTVKDESAVPQLFTYTVKVTYAGNYSVSPSALESNGLLPPTWRDTAKNPNVSSISLRKRIPLAWSAAAVPTGNTHARKAVDAPASYGIVARSGKVETPRHFEARGPGALVAETQRSSRAVATLDRNDRASGFSDLKVIIELMETNPAKAEKALRAIGWVEDAKFSDAIIAVTGNYGGDDLRSEYFDLLGNAIPMIPRLIWTDGAGDVPPNAIAEFAASHATKNDWEEDEGIRGLRNKLSGLGGHYKGLKEKLAVEFENEMVTHSRSTAALKLEVTRLYELHKNTDNTDYRAANEKYKSANQTKVETEKRLKKALDDQKRLLTQEE